MVMKRKKQIVQIILTVLLSLCVTACGKQANKNYETETEYITEDMTESGNKTEKDVTPTEGTPEEGNTEVTIEENVSKTADIQEVGQSEDDNIITTYLTETIEYSDEVIPVQYVDDLSLMADMKYTNNTYVYQDGKVFYRRYHVDSYEESALWGMYDPIPETKKEIVCIDADGVEKELFSDEGYGDIYLINNRFYMTDGNLCEDGGSIYTQKNLYSVDMQGNDRIDYGNGKILVVDKERSIVILQIQEEDGTCYYTMNYETGEQKLILSDYDHDDYYINIGAYQDGLLYYEKYIMGDATICRLCAVSMEGEQKEIIALTSELNKSSYSYKESICHMEVDGDRIYFVFGGYDGSAAMFQGGMLISTKLDGTDYKAVATEGDTFYLCHDNGRTLVYFPSYYMPLADSDQECDMTVWDVDANICSPAEFPQSILLAYDRQMRLIWRYYPEEKGAMCELTLYKYEIDEEKADIYAVPDDSGKIVRVAMNLEDSIEKRKTDEADKIQFEDLYYADGFLYFTVEYSIYNAEASVGWRDGYRRLQSDVYRLKTGEHTAKLLYSY